MVCSSPLNTAIIVRFFQSRPVNSQIYASTFRELRKLDGGTSTKKYNTSLGRSTCVALDFALAISTWNQFADAVPADGTSSSVGLKNALYARDNLPVFAIYRRSCKVNNLIGQLRVLITGTGRKRSASSLETVQLVTYFSAVFSICVCADIILTSKKFIAQANDKCEFDSGLLRDLLARLVWFGFLLT